MAKYEYDVVETRSEEVPNCPLCGSDDLKFWNYSRDDSMHGAAAGVKCKRCGHEVKVDGNELHMDWGEDCQMAAITEWKNQVAMWGKHKPEVPPDIKELQAKLAKLGEENQILKCVIALENYCPSIGTMDYQHGMADMKAKFLSIMEEFLKGQRT